MDDLKVTAEGKVNLSLIYGSTRPGRFCDRVARWTALQIERSGLFNLEILDMASPPAGEDGSLDNGAPQWMTERLTRADAFVVVTPEYNHGYPAPLKALIDATGAEWRAKPVAFVSYGGVSGGIRAVEQLRQVFAEMHAMTIRDAVALPNPWDQFDADGNVQNPERCERSAATMLERLHWWAMALRIGRNAVPYSVAA